MPSRSRFLPIALTLLAGRTAVMQSRPAPGPERTSIETYSYDARGRADPFVSLLGSGAEPAPALNRADGAAGLTLAEISVRGVMQGRGTTIAIIQGPDKKTYLVRAGDRFADARLESISSDGLVFLQDVRNPLSGAKRREVRKPLRSVERARP
jgi:Tfp pilus assembly protein PilP